MTRERMRHILAEEVEKPPTPSTPSTSRKSGMVRTAPGSRRRSPQWSARSRKLSPSS